MGKNNKIEEYKNKLIKVLRKMQKCIIKHFNFIYVLFTVILLSFVILIVIGVINWNITLFIITSLLLLNLPFFIYLVASKESNDKPASLNTAYSTLIILNLSLYPLVTIYDQYQAKIKNQVSYTIGFRAWKSTVKISNIEITYWDEYGNQIRIDESINNSKFWFKEIWKDTSTRDNGNTLSKVEFKNDTILLRNCGIALKLEELPKEKKKKLKSIKDCKIEADITFIEKDPYYEKEYYSVQVCLKIPKYDDTVKFESYLSSELFFHDVTTSKFWIPDFDVQFLDQRLVHYKDMTDPSPKTQIINFTDSIVCDINGLKYPKNSTNQKFRLYPNTTIRVSSILFKGTTSFTIKNPVGGDSAPLFNFFIPENDMWGAFVRE